MRRTSDYIYELQGRLAAMMNFSAEKVTGNSRREGC